MKKRQNPIGMTPIIITALLGAAGIAAAVMLKKKPRVLPPGIPPALAPPPEKKTPLEEYQDKARELIGERTLEKLPAGVASSAWNEIKKLMPSAAKTDEAWAEAEKLRIAAMAAETAKLKEEVIKAKQKAASAAKEAAIKETAVAQEGDDLIRDMKKLESDKAAEKAATEEEILDEKEGEEEISEGEMKPRKKPGAQQVAGTALSGAKLLGVGLPTMALVGGIAVVAVAAFEGMKRLQKKFRKYKKLAKAYNAQASLYAGERKKVETATRKLRSEMNLTKRGLDRLRAYARKGA